MPATTTIDHAAVDPADATAALQQAIDRCHERGGGTVHVSAGLYEVTTIQLKSNVELNLGPGATLRGRFDDAGYRPIDPELADTTALVFARDATNVAITGSGCIDGQGPRYWKKLDRPRSRRPDVAEVGVIQFWYEHDTSLAKPHRLVAFLRCTKVRLVDVRLTQATSWTCHLIACRDVKIRGIDIDNPLEGPNTDGIDVDGSSDVLISDCTIRTGDDAVVLKTKNIFANHTPIRNVTVTNCRFHTGCNGFKIGTETREDIENVCFSNTTIHSPDDAAPVERAITGIVIESVDGAHVRNIACSNITLINARTPLFIRLGQRLQGQRTRAGSISAVAISNILAVGATHPSVISGIPGNPIQDLQFHNIQIQTRGGGRDTVQQIGEVPEHIADYPEVFMFGQVPASVLYARHVARMQLSNWLTRVHRPDARPQLTTQDVVGLQQSATPFN